jgi:hypothetical protein
MAPTTTASPCRLTEQEVELRLEEASRTLYHLRVVGVSPAQIRSSMPEVVHTFEEAYGWTAAEPRAPVPQAREVTRMDQAFAWLRLIPEDRRVLRRVVALRSLTKPGTGKHLMGWRKIGDRLGASHEAVRLWHAQGIAIIAAALNRWADPGRAGLCHAAGGPVGPTREQVACVIARVRARKETAVPRRAPRTCILAGVDTSDDSR